LYWLAIRPQLTCYRIAFEKEQVQSIDDRLSALKRTCTTEQDNLSRVQQERVDTQQELQDIENELENMRESLKAAEEEASSKTNEAESIKKSTSKSNSAYQKALKEISSWNDDIERLASERFAVYRRCKLEEIELPLKSGFLTEVPLEEVREPLVCPQLLRSIFVESPRYHGDGHRPRGRRYTAANSSE